MAATRAPEMDPEKAKRTALEMIEYIKGFADSMDLTNPRRGVFATILELEVVKERLAPGGLPFRSEAEVDRLFAPVTGAILNFRSQLTAQLTAYFLAHKDAIEIALRTGATYRPLAHLHANRRRIEELFNKYHGVVQSIRQDSNDPMSIYGLLFFHILKTDTIEHVLLQQFTELLESFGLQQKYDAIEIFSVGGKVARGSKFCTRAQAIRNALAHNKFELTFKDSTWQIKFNNTELGNNYDQTLQKEEFLRYLVDTDTLYKASQMLLFRIVSSTLIRKHFVRKA